MTEMCDAEKIVEWLKAEGWKEQMSGMIYINGTLGTNLLKGKEVITIQQDFYPDDEFLEQEWPADEPQTTSLAGTQDSSRAVQPGGVQ
jgi:hypothetical protein